MKTFGPVTLEITAARALVVAGLVRATLLQCREDRDQAGRLASVLEHLANDILFLLFTVAKVLDFETVRGGQSLPLVLDLIR